MATTKNANDTTDAAVESGTLSPADLTAMFADLADSIKTGMSDAIGAANARVNAPRSITLPVAAPKDTSDKVILMAGREALEVPRNSAHVLEGMGWERKGANTKVKPGMVTMTLPGFDADPITVPAGQVGHLQASGWVVKD